MVGTFKLKGMRIMLKKLVRTSLFFLTFVMVLTTHAQAQVIGEKGRICEAKPVMKCLDKEKIEGTTLRVPQDDAAIAKDGFLICDSSFNYTTSPDIVLIMDNTASMANNRILDGIPRWCTTAKDPPDDPGCISGDPDSLRGPALRTFIDSALVKGGVGMNIGVVTFSDFAVPKSQSLLPLTIATRDAIKASIIMDAEGATNYTTAFQAAIDLLLTSKKPKSEQFIIFVSDGRPNLPISDEGGPYLYKAFLDKLPTVHSIFLGDNQANYKDMQDISQHTGGSFFPIKDVGLLAGILTDSLAKKLFRRALPTLTTVKNITTSSTFQVKDSKHVLAVGSTSYTLQLPGPLYLKPGINDLVVKTEYGFSDNVQEVHFKVERTATGPFSNIVESCRDLPKLLVYNSHDQPINLLGLPININDSLLRYSLTTSAQGLDSFDVVVRTTSTTTAQHDLEAIPNTDANRKDSTWNNSEPFQHQTIVKKPGDRLVQVEHAETVILAYHNPYIPDDSVQVKVLVKYGPDFDKSAYWDLDADGRIETVDIHLKELLRALPNKLKFHITDALGVGYDRTAQLSAKEIAFGLKSDNSTDPSHIVVTLANPFPFGVTSVAFPDTSGRTFLQWDVPFVNTTFRVDDSVPPVILKADVVNKDKDNPLIRILITYSEPITLDLQLAMEPVVFKRDTAVFTIDQMPVERIQKLSETEYTYHLKSGSTFTPVGGDFVAINNNGETKDLFGRTPTVRIFTPMGGAVPSQSVTDFYVTFANGSKSKAEAVPTSPEPDHVLIPVDSKGYAIPGRSENGKCENCVAKEGDLFLGSVIVVVTKYPVTYTFSIFTNLGQLVAKATGKIEEEDLKLLDKKEDPTHNPNLTEYTQRIVWTGRTLNRQMAGTGAYVLKATFHYDQSFKTGARSSFSTKLTKFGFLRTCCNTQNSGWFD